jgi:hypothetical protein
MYINEGGRPLLCLLAIVAIVAIVSVLFIPDWLFKFL